MISKKYNISIFLLFFSIIFTHIGYAETTDSKADLCITDSSMANGKGEWDFKKLIIQEYKKNGLPPPDWNDQYFEENYTYSELWKRITNRFYNLFAEKYHIPLNWFLFKALKKYDWAILWDTSGKANYCYLAEFLIKIAKEIRSVYPEVSQWIRQKIAAPDQILPLPLSRMKSDLYPLMVKSGVDEQTYSYHNLPILTLGSDLGLGSEDLTHKLIDYAKRLKKELLEELKARENE